MTCNRVEIVVELRVEIVVDVGFVLRVEIVVDVGFVLRVLVRVVAEAAMEVGVGVKTSCGTRCPLLI